MSGNTSPSASPLIAEVSPFLRIFSVLHAVFTSIGPSTTHAPSSPAAALSIISLYPTVKGKCFSPTFSEQWTSAIFGFSMPKARATYAIYFTCSMRCCCVG